MPLPNFLIIGAAKAGTTALYAALRQHPQVYTCAVKEPRFFAFEDETPAFGGPAFNDYVQYPTITRLPDYLALFADATGAKAIGEASTVYLYYPGDKPSERIRHYIPDVKLIAILRQPADRAYSNFLHAVHHDWEPLDDFERAWADESRRIAENWSYFLRYRQNGCYDAQLRPYYERFDGRQIRIVLYEDWLSNPGATIRDVFQFLEVDESFEPDLSDHYNISRIPRSRWMHRLLHRSRLGAALHCLPRPARNLVIGRINRLNLHRPMLSPGLRRRLTAEYRQEILRLQDLIGCDLSHWLAA